MAIVIACSLTVIRILRGDKIALVGANGKGKSTVLRMVHGSEPCGGIIEQGWNVESAFFAQHQLEALNLKNDLLSELSTVSAEYTDWELRTVLGCFLFTTLTATICTLTVNTITCPAVSTSTII